ncbi:hypothetical protein D3OALGB2SA_3151 [Olavius algarvensis associated proteobacterium Delta 3]|nr:hypothetical protein D3OALGB2SA_3151 [Olavius algarvensis associated proteobacterium Delta 3]
MIIRTLTQMPKRVIGSCPKMRIGTGIKPSTDFEDYLRLSARYRQ